PLAPASREQPRPRLCDQVREPTHRALPAHMLEDYEPAFGCEHTPDLAEGGGHIVDRAQHKRDVYRVANVVRERNRLAEPIDDVNCNAVAASKSGRRPPERRHRLHGGAPPDRRREKHEDRATDETDA